MDIFKEVYEKAYQDEFEKVASNYHQAASQAVLSKKISPEDLLRRERARKFGKNFQISGKKGKGLLRIVGKSIRKG